jgi:hypothetical protein
LIESTSAGKSTKRWLGTIKPSESVEIPPAAPDVELPRIDSSPGPDANPFLNALQASLGEREEDQGELRLIAWIKSTVDGQMIDPPIDRKRGFTAVLVHLRSGPPPSPDGKRYNLLAEGSLTSGQPVVEQPESVRPEVGQSSRAGRRRAAPAPKSAAPAKAVPGTSSRMTPSRPEQVAGDF